MPGTLASRLRIAGACGLPALSFVLGSLALHALLSHAPPTIAVDLAQPLPVVTAWHEFGAIAWAVLAASVAAGAIGWWFAARALARVAPNDVAFASGALALGCVAALAAALTWPAIFSSDLYAYAVYGDLARHGADAYAHRPLALHDALAQAAIWQWGDPPPVCVYGPAFVALAAAVVGITDGAVIPTLWLFRLIACAAFLASSFLFRLVLRDVAPQRRMSALAVYTLNPVALWSCAEGHNDALMLCVVFAGIALVQRSHAFAGTLLVALGALVKAPALAAAAVVALAMRASPVRRAAVGARLGFAAGAVLVALAGWSLERGASAALGVHGHYLPQFSLQAIGDALAGIWGIALVLAACAGLALTGMRDLFTGKRSGYLLLAGALWLAIPNPYPWYGLWVLPVAAASEGALAGALAGGTIAIVVRYLPDAVGSIEPALRLVVTLLGLSPFAFSLLRAPRRDPKGAGAA